MGSGILFQVHSLSHSSSSCDVSFSFLSVFSFVLSSHMTDFSQDAKKNGAASPQTNTAG